MPRRELALAVAFVALGGCTPTADIRIGEMVPVQELYAARADLRRWIDSELASGRTDRAFYGLEILKTRSFAAQRLAAATGETRHDVVADLRPTFRRTFGAPSAPGNEPREEQLLLASRGLNRVEGTAVTSLAERDATGEQAFWDDLRLYQTRLAEYVPYAHAARHSFAVVTSREAQMLIGPSDVGLSFFVHGDGRVTAFVVRGDIVTARSVRASAEELHGMTKDLLTAVSHPPTSSSALPWESAAERLYDALLGPVADVLGDDRVSNVYVAPDGFLANVPFALLRERRGEGRALLLERVRFTYMPSFTVYRRLMMRTIMTRPPSLLAVGNPTFSVAVPSLPAAEREARAIARVFDDSTLLLRDDAVEGGVSDGLRRHNIAHFATHGVLLSDQAPGASSLLVAADDQRDGFLSAAEISGLDLSHLYLAVLSACETSVGDDRSESLDVASLTGAFLTAGAPSVVGSLWKVSDDSTTELLLAFYSAFLERGTGDALREAQLALRKRDEFSHPYFWGAFVLYGWDK